MNVAALRVCYTTDLADLFLYKKVCSFLEAHEVMYAKAV